jgi:hypothetical protein
VIDIKIRETSLAIVLREVGRIVTIGALCCAIGLHWVALQSFAWTSMLIEYSKRAPLCQAIAQTFDGAHPCSLCHFVNKGKSSEKKSDLQSPDAKGRHDLRVAVEPLDTTVYSFRIYGVRFFFF